MRLSREQAHHWSVTVLSLFNIFIFFLLWLYCMLKNDGCFISLGTKFRRLCECCTIDRVVYAVGVAWPLLWFHNVRISLFALEIQLVWRIYERLLFRCLDGCPQSKFSKRLYISQNKSITRVIIFRVLRERTRNRRKMLQKNKKKRNLYRKMTIHQMFHRLDPLSDFGQYLHVKFMKRIGKHRTTQPIDW